MKSIKLTFPKYISSENKHYKFSELLCTQYFSNDTVYVSLGNFSYRSIVNDNKLTTIGFLLLCEILVKAKSIKFISINHV